MERISILEKEIADLRKTLAEKENELYEIKKKWLSRPQSDCQLQVNPNGLHSQAQVGQLPRWAIERYSRQILLPEVGVSGQAALVCARALVVGAGGLGCPAAAYLAGAGVGEIGIVDYDTVDVTNIHRQLLHGESDQACSKVQSAANALRRINSNITVTPYETQLTSSNALDIVSKYQVVLDCTDNVPTRYLLNDACALTKLPLISGSALKMEGQITVYGYRAPKDPSETEWYQGPCYRCLFPAPPPPESVGSCSANGVAGPVPGVIGALQALEAIKLIVGHPYKKLLVERMVIFDGEDCTFRTVKLRPRSAECAACSATPTITRLLDYETFCKAKAKEKKKDVGKIKSQRRKEEKEKRMSGRSYFGFRKDRDGDRWVQDVVKAGRSMGPACDSPYCAKGTARKCPSFGEDVRAKIFEYFWNELDWAGKKNLDLDLSILPPAHRITALELSQLLSRSHSSASHPSRSHILVDVRSAPEFDMCHIDGALNCPIETLYGKTMDKLMEEIQNTAQVTFVCRRGNDSQLAARRILNALATSGTRDVTNLTSDVPHVTSDVTNVMSDASNVKSDASNVKSGASNMMSDVTNFISGVSHVTSDVLNVMSDVPHVTSDVRDVRVCDVIGGLHSWAEHVDNNFPVY